MIPRLVDETHTHNPYSEPIPVPPLHLIPKLLWVSPKFIDDMFRVKRLSEIEERVTRMSTDDDNRYCLLLIQLSV